jgi:transcriptional regulator with XRE-family HTH domain
MSILGDRLREEREKRGWSQVLVAKKLGLKRSSTYANWEYGTREPDLEMLNKIAEMYEIYIDDLTKTNNDQKSKQDKVIEAKLKVADEIMKLPDDKRKIIEDLLRNFNNDKNS